MRRLEYQDNAQFNNLETVLIQNDVSCLYTYAYCQAAGAPEHKAEDREEEVVRFCEVSSSVTFQMPMWSTTCRF